MHGLMYTILLHIGIIIAVHLHKCSSSGCTYLHYFTGPPMGHSFSSKFLKFNIILQKPFGRKWSLFMFIVPIWIQKWQKQEAPKCENGILCYADIFCVALTVFSLKKGSKWVQHPNFWILILSPILKCIFRRFHMNFSAFVRQIWHRSYGYQDKKYQNEPKGTTS